MGVTAITNAVDFEDDDECEIELPECISASTLIAKRPKDIEWLFEGFIPMGKVGIIAAQGGTGKSMLALQLCVAVATDLPACDGMWQVGTNAKGSALYFAGEEAEEDLARRFWPIKLQLCDLARNHQERNVLSLSKTKLATCLKNFKIVPMAGLHAPFLEDGEETTFYQNALDIAQNIPDLKLIIVDPLRRLHTSEENDSGSATKIMTMLDRLAKATGATVIAIHHVAKSAATVKDKWDQNTARGSSAITDSARFQINLVTLNEKDLNGLGIANDQRGKFISVALTKSNYAPPQSELLYLERKDGGYLSHYTPDNSCVGSDDLEAAILRLVKESEGTGNPMGKTKFKKCYAHNGLNAGEKRIGATIDSLLDGKVLFQVPAPSTNGPGRKALLLSTQPESATPQRRRRSRKKTD